MTTDRECPCGNDAVRDQAALWFARSRDSDLAAPERASFEAWLAEHHQHAHEFRLLQNLWGTVDPLPKLPVDAQRQPDAPASSPAAHSTRRRAFVPYVVVGCLLAMLVGGSVYFSLDPEPDYSAEFTTLPGERRQVALPDGTVLDLNGRTRINAHFFSETRRVELSEGEAMFSVEHDSSRPFVVQTGNGIVTVTGTRFQVRRDPTRTSVLVVSGTVEVKGRADGQGNRVTLTGGMGTSIDSSGKVAPALEMSTDAATAGE